MSCNLTLCKPSQKKSQPHKTLGLFLPALVQNHCSKQEALKPVRCQSLSLSQDAGLWDYGLQESCVQMPVIPGLKLLSYHLSFNEIIQAFLTVHLYVAINERETAFVSMCPEPVIAWQEGQIPDSDCSACAGSGHHPDADTLAPDSLPTE